MAIEFDYFFKSIYGSVYTSPIGKLLENVLYFSIILSVLILLIVIFIYPVGKKAQSGAVSSSFKLVFYIFITVMLMTSLHHGVVEYKFEEKYSNQMNKEILNAVKGGSLNTLLGSGEKINIKPKIVEPDDMINDSMAASHMSNEFINSSDGGDTYVPPYPADSKFQTVEDMLAELES